MNSHTLGGGLLIDEPYSISFDSDGKWYVSGEFGGPADLDPTLGNNTVSSNGSFDQFISVFDSNDNYLLTKKFGTATDVNWFEEIPYEAYVDNDTLYVTGNIINTSDLNPEIGTDNYVSHGGFDVYFATYSLATPGITIAPTTGLVTTESGGFATTSVVLNAKPTDNVVLNLSVSNPTEGLLASSSIVFTTTNWNIPQIVTVTGKDDISLDGDTLFTLVTDGTTSTDIGYVIPGINIPDVVVTNIDNDTLPLFVSGDGGMYRLGGCIDPLAINFERYATYQSGVCMYNSSSTTTPPLIEDVKTTPFGVCSKYITIKDRVVFGKRNDVEIVKKIQSYLNNYEGETLVVDGEYKEVDVVAVRKFQEKYGDQILAPWGFKSSTGIVAVTTVAKINSVVCAQAVTCPYFSVLTKDGESNSDVPRIKSFLNIVMNTNLDTESFLFDRETIKAVKSFQVKYTKFILQPWGLKQPTGWWYQTTIQQANKFMGCPVSELTLPNGSVIK